MNTRAQHVLIVEDDLIYAEQLQRSLQKSFLNTA